MADDVEPKAKSARPDFEEMARSIHASYLRRWNRHDPRVVADGAAQPGPVQPPTRRGISAA